MHGSLTEKESSLIAELPPIVRTRAHRLYAADGSRWVDCWADDGRALLGHTPKGLSLRLKNEISRGVYAPYPNRWSSRLEKAMLSLFPGYNALLIYQNANQAMQALNLKEPPADPLYLDTKIKKVQGALWGRPLLPDHPLADILFPILPVPGFSIFGAQPVLTAIRSTPSILPDAIPPISLAAMLYACTLLRKERDSHSSDAIKDADTWRRRGSYIMFRKDKAKYEILFRNFLRKRILLAPSMERPSIIPEGLSDYEIALLNDKRISSDE